MHPLRYMPFVRDAIFTLASGLHEILEVKTPGSNRVAGPHLHAAIKRSGFANGITGQIKFKSEGVDRDFQHMNYIVFNAQNGAFVRVGTILEDTPEFKDCAQYKSKYGTTLSRECKDMIFRGLYELITVARRLPHSLLHCIVAALAFWTDGTANVPDVRVFRESTFLCVFFVCAVSIFPDIC